MQHLSLLHTDSQQTSLSMLKCLRPCTSDMVFTCRDSNQVFPFSKLSERRGTTRRDLTFTFTQFLQKVLHRNSSSLSEETCETCCQLFLTLWSLMHLYGFRLPISTGTKKLSAGWTQRFRRLWWTPQRGKGQRMRRNELVSAIISAVMSWSFWSAYRNTHSHTNTHTHAYTPDDSL